LQPGDIVEIEGNHTYTGTFAIDGPSGTATNPIIIRGVKTAGKRPVLQSNGGRTLNVHGNHIVLEGVELTGGQICYRHHGDQNVIRDCVIHHCDNGILGTDEGSGSLTLEYTEIHHCGTGDQHHQVYMSTDSNNHPGSVFRMQFCYIHDGAGGNNIKSRAERNELYYNWIENSTYHELELIGPDGAVWDPWGEHAPREDSDIVGNVIVSKSSSAWSAIRVGGDGTGGTGGRFRFVNNTIVVKRDLSGAVFRLFSRLESVEMHNNVFFTNGGAVRIWLQQGIEPSSWDIFENRDDLVWSTGTRVMGGSNNWVDAKATKIPTEWTGTLKGADPGFENAAGNDFRPKTTSPLVNAGNHAPSSPQNFAFPNGQFPPNFMPPARSLLAAGSAAARPTSGVGVIDIGAYESGVTGPPPPPPADSGVTPPPDSGVTPPPADGGVTPPPADSGTNPPPRDGSTPTADASRSQDASNPSNPYNRNELSGGCQIANPSLWSALPALFFALFLAFAAFRRLQK
jgi:hypothetical protein